MREELLARREELFGVSEVADYYGVSKQVIANWQVRGKLPLPIVKLKMGPIWYKSQLKKP